MDALVLFEACLTGKLAHVPRRPHDRERADLIQSGNVFIYEEHASGIKRWTDGVPWSPSRILGNFLIYRELDKPFQPGEKKRAMKRNKPEGVSKLVPSPKTSPTTAFGTVSLASGSGLGTVDTTVDGNDAERSFLGSLIDSYSFKENGLVKKTISVQYRGIQHHLVSYYSLSDAKEHRLGTVSSAVELRGIVPRQQLVSSGNFRSPVDDNEFNCMEPPMRGYGYNPAVTYSNMQGLPMRSMSIPPSIPPSIPAPVSGYAPAQTWANTPHYNMSSSPYSLTQPTHPPDPSFPDHLMPLSYENSYSVTPSRQPGYSPVPQPVRRHSAMPNMNGAGQLSYPANTNTGGFLVHGNSNLTGHGLHDDSYNLGGDIFGTSASHAATEGDSMVSTTSYTPTNTMAHDTVSFGGQLSHDYNHTMAQMTISGLRDSLADPGMAGFGSASPNAEPTNLELNLDDTDTPSGGNEWEEQLTDHTLKRDSGPW